MAKKMSLTTQLSQKNRDAASPPFFFLVGGGKKVAIASSEIRRETSNRQTDGGAKVQASRASALERIEIVS